MQLSYLSFICKGWTSNMGVRIPLLGTTVLLLMLVASLTVVEAWQFNVVHKYAHLEGSPANRDDSSMSPEYFKTLVEHHHQRRRLLAPAVFSLGGNGDVTGANAVGLYYTQVGLGTPMREFYVQVDTGSNVLWVDCAPCTGCPTSSTLPGVTVDPYDPAVSSTDTTLLCTSTNCAPASNSATPSCDANGACSFDIVYGDGSNVTGSILNDVFTFVQYINSTASTTATANIYFGCGSTLGGFEQSQVDGLIGFGKAAVAVPNQLATQGLAANQFAHCLEGDSTIGGGFFVIANITEPGLVYTPQIPGKGLYYVGLQNIAVNGANITTPASFEISPGLNAGVIMDSGTTFATVAEPAYTQFLTAVSNAVLPIQAVQDQDGFICWPFSGDIATTFPPVTLFFDGGAMNLGPRNYLFPVTESSGAPYQCLGWQTGTLPTSTSSITIWGDIVLKDQLIVYDNDLQRIGWKPFNCSVPISVSI